MSDTTTELAHGHVLTADAAPTASDVRTWARTKGLEVGARGRIPSGVVDAYNADHVTHYQPA